MPFYVPLDTTINNVYKHNTMENFWLIDDDDTILDRCLTSSVKEAQQIFDNKGWVIGQVLSEADWMNDQLLNNLENQSSEC